MLSAVSAQSGVEGPGSRRALYMGALVASRYNPVIRGFTTDLLPPVSPKKVALVACMRKLLMILNSMCRHNAYWLGASTSQKGLSAA